MQIDRATIAIVGLGLMGGSLAMALRRSCSRIVGITRRQDVAQLALRQGIVDVASFKLSAATHADIVVLAAPVRHILATIPEVAALMRPGALLIDLGSTKAEVVEAMNCVPEGIGAVGGHPMCGKETGGLESASADLFTGATFVMTPTMRSTHDAIVLAHEMVLATGAKPLVLDAERHDRAVAIISHLPYLLAASLMHVQSDAGAADGIEGKLASSGFRDTSRLAASSLDMMLDILLTNREPVLSALEGLEQQLGQVRALLDNEEGLRAWMAEARCGRMEMYK